MLCADNKIMLKVILPEKVAVEIHLVKPVIAAAFL